MYVKSETSPTIFEVQGNKLYYTHRDEGVRDDEWTAGDLTKHELLQLLCPHPNTPDLTTLVLINDIFKLLNIRQ